MSLPTDTITYSAEINGTQTIELATITTTILGFASHQSAVASDTKLKCGETLIANNFARDFDYVPLNYVCKDILKIEKTGQDTAMVIVNYANRDISLQNNFTYGETIISIFVFMIFIILFYKCLASAIFHRKITIKRNEI